MNVLAVVMTATVTLVSPALAWLQTPPPAAGSSSRDFQVSAAKTWSPTDLELRAGERAVFTASGTAQCPGQEDPFGPAGLPRGFRDLLRALPVGQAARGALVGRIGDEVAQPFVIGTGADIVAPAGGVLALGVNHAEDDLCTGRFSVHVDVFAPDEHAHVVVAKRVEALEGVDQALFARLPRRVSDRQGNPGDMINFLILGPEAGMRRVFEASGWLKVDSDTRDALIAGVIDSVLKQPYLTLPMSQLYLFNRVQDVGWAHAEPIKVASSRHHLRIWQAPFQAGTSTVWVGAATHDVGFERDQRNNGITHKIDPNVDAEREYVEKTLTGTGLVSEFTYVTPDNPLREAKTATGGSFQSDGRVLVLKLDQSAAAPPPAGR
jgi:hypothetical protein